MSAADAQLLAELATATDALRDAVDRLDFPPPVACVYNPLDYARAMYDAYLARFARRGVTALLLGMNPGPFGMVQTGVPFGEIAAVRDWMQLSASIRAPRRSLEARPVEGLACARSEVSGARLWGWARDRFGMPEHFRRHFFVANYCPLAFLAQTGRNITPDAIPIAQRSALQAACDDGLAALLRILKPERVIGIGGFAAAAARRTIDTEQLELPVGVILHPSPASPAANRGWQPQIERQLREQGLACAAGWRESA